MGALGENIKKARIEKGMTQAQLAEAVNTSKAAISRYEANRRQPRHELIVEISKALGVDVYEIFLGCSKEQFQHKLDVEVRTHEAELEDTYLPVAVKALVSAFNLLNEDGQRKAIERVEELTEIAKYRHPEQQPTIGHNSKRGE